MKLETEGSGKGVWGALEVLIHSAYTPTLYPHLAWVETAITGPYPPLLSTQGIDVGSTIAIALSSWMSMWVLEENKTRHVSSLITASKLQ
jgi:hypothetical protein